MSFDRRRCTSTSFKLFILIWVKKRGNFSSQNSNNRSITNHGICRRWQLLQSALALHLDATMSGRCEGEDTLAFPLMRIFRFWRNGEFTFFQGCLHPHYFSWSFPPHPPTLASLPFCAGVQFSRNSVRAFNDQIKILYYFSVEDFPTRVFDVSVVVLKNSGCSSASGASTFSCLMACLIFCLVWCLVPISSRILTAAESLVLDYWASLWNAPGPIAQSFGHLYLWAWFHSRPSLVCETAFGFLSCFCCFLILLGKVFNVSSLSCLMHRFTKAFLLRLLAR